VPRAHGFDTDHWTLARITGVVEQLTGVAYHPGHVWKLLRRLHCRLQRPPAARSNATRSPAPAG
jgi:transposase